MNIQFIPQNRQNYSVPAAIKMLSNTVELQENIYIDFMMEKKKVFINTQSATKFFNTTLISEREMFFVIFTRLLSKYHSNVKIYPSDSIIAPGLLLLKDPKNKNARHCVIVKEVSNKQLFLFDPTNPEPIMVLEMRIKPFILGKYKLLDNAMNLRI